MKRPFKNKRPFGPFVAEGVEGKYIIDISPFNKPKEEKEPLFTFTGQVISNGRVTIPNSFTEEHDISVDDTVDFRIEYEENQFITGDSKVYVRNRINIPPVTYKSEGDRVTIEVLEVNEDN